MRIQLLSIALLAMFTTFISCNDKDAKVPVADLEVVSDSQVVNPMAHVMDSATAGGKKFSAVKNSDISLQDDAITLNSQTELTNEKAYLVFADDQSKVELFLPNSKAGIMLTREGTEGNYIWKNDKYELIVWKGYVLRTLKDDTPLFSGDSL